MTGRSLPALVLVAGLASAGPGDDPYDTLPATASALLDEAESLELLSLDPGGRTPDVASGFHGWKILGRTTLRDASGRKAIVAAIRRGVREADDASGCFEPRHGLRATKGGKDVDLVICFSCRWIEVREGREIAFVRTSALAKRAINKALRDATVDLAQDVEGP
jgi:hypothetical protein